MTMLHRLMPGVLLAFAGCGGCHKADERIVVYCAQDREFAEGLFAEFTGRHSLVVLPKFDTEANKSVSLVAELEQEAGRPRCDVHWNNEILGTIRLARQGLYEPYTPAAAANFPGETRDTGGLWQAFAERARVLIVNTERVPADQRPTSLFDLTRPEFKSQVALAKPLFGTTATHAACLFEVLGRDAARRFFRDLKANDVQMVAGNKQVATGVAGGRYAVGLTDTDDAIIELLAGKPVAIVFPDAVGQAEHPRFGTLFIPNTLALVKGAPNPEGGKKLIEYLLSEDSERKLAQGGGYQLPVNPALRDAAHPALKTRHQVHAMTVDWHRAADLWQETQEFLRAEFAR